MPTGVNSRRLARFSLGTLLFVTLCVAGYFGGYRRGFDVGLQSGRAVQLKSYAVADLLAPNSLAVTTADVNNLIRVIELTVAPETWKSHGLGVGQIKFLPDNLSLLVYQSPEAHDQVVDLLSSLRKQNQLNRMLQHID